MIISIKFQLIHFPFDEISPEQIQVMFILQKLWEKRTNGIIGVPPTLNLPATVISFYLSCPFECNNNIRLMYLTETLIEKEKIFYIIEKFYNNLKYILNERKKKTFLISSFLQKAKLCINSKFKKEYNNEEIEDLCLSLILPRIEKKKPTSKDKYKKYFERSYQKYQSCPYFKNFQEKKFKKNYGIWGLKNIRKEAFKKKICPFFFSREIIFQSQLIVIEFKNFFSSDILGLDIKRLIKTSFLIADSIRNFDGILANFTVSELNCLILNDSLRGLLYLKKSFLNLSSKKFSFMNDSTPIKNLIDFNKIGFFIKKNPKFVSNYCNIFNQSSSKTLFSKRILNLIDVLLEISEFFQLIFKNKININTSLDRFFNILFRRIKNHRFNSKYLLHLCDYIIVTCLKAGTSDYRFLSGVKYLGLFLLKFGLLLESTSENFRVLTNRQTTRNHLTIESLFFLCCFEIPVFSKILYENSMSFLIFTTQNSFLYSNLSIFDQNQIYYGNIRVIFKKCFISYQELIFEKNFDQKNSKDLLEKSSIISKKMLSSMIKAFESPSTGILCIFSSYSILLDFIEHFNNSITLKQVKDYRNIFIETLESNLDFRLLENYKMCCDLGVKSIFFALSDGILSEINIENHYSRFVLKIQTKELFLNKYKKIYSIWQNLPLNNFSFPYLLKNENYSDQNFIFRKFFGSKKDYGIFLNLVQYYKLPLGFNCSNLEVIDDKKKFKKEGLTLNEKIYRFFNFFSDFNIGI